MWPLFVCKVCGHAENANLNVAGVLQAHGVRALRSSEVHFYQTKTSWVRSRQESKAGMARTGCFSTSCACEEFARRVTPQATFRKSGWRTHFLPMQRPSHECMVEHRPQGGLDRIAENLKK